MGTDYSGGCDSSCNRLDQYKFVIGKKEILPKPNQDMLSSQRSSTLNASEGIKLKNIINRMKINGGEEPFDVDEFKIIFDPNSSEQDKDREIRKIIRSGVEADLARGKNNTEYIKNLKVRHALLVSREEKTVAHHNQLRDAFFNRKTSRFIIKAQSPTTAEKEAKNIKNK